MRDSEPFRLAKVKQFAESKRSWRLGYKTAVQRLAAVLVPEEALVDMATGQSDKQLAVVLVTDRRVFVAKQKSGALVQKVIIEEFPLTNVSSVESGGGFLGKLSIYASGNSCEMTRMNVQEAQSVAAAIRERMGVSHAAPAQAAAGSVADELKKLAALRDSGVLTDEEFQAQKRRLLA
jgi:hypothetical protein